MKFSAVEWQSFSQKKDLEQIKKYIERQQHYETSFLSQIISIFLGTALTLGLSLSEKEIDIAVIKIIWIFISLVCLFALLYPWIKYNIKERITKKRNKLIKPAQEFINSFDNEICYFVLMSDSYFQMLNKATASSTPPKNELVCFYYIEGSYYFNKAVGEMCSLHNIVNDVLTTNTNSIISERKISVLRYHNIVDILEGIYTQIKANSNIVDIMVQDDIDLINNINKQFYEKLEQLQSHVEEQLET